MKKISRNFHIPSLDGIRAVAMMLVFVSHAGLPNLFPGGFGVTIFFFLSGYLITTLMRREYEKTGTISFKNFYLRRIYRIFPPLYIVLLLAFLLAISGVFKHDMRPWAVVSQILYWTNYYYIFIGKSYFVPHTSMYWSLAVEEHFYFIFPVLFFWAVRYRSYKVSAVLFFSICVVGLTWRYWLVLGFNVTDIYTYRATDARFDSLMYGCILGVWQNPMIDKEWKLSNRSRWAILVSAISVLLICLLYRDDTFRQTLRYSLQGAALFPVFWLAVKYPDWWVFSWLNFRPVRFLGLVSYTFYLSHVTMLELVGKYLHLHGFVRGIAGFVATLMFSSLMYYVVEKPIVRLRRQLHRELQ